MMAPMWHLSHISGLFSRRTSAIASRRAAVRSEMPFKWFRLRSSCFKWPSPDKMCKSIELRWLPDRFRPRMSLTAARMWLGSRPKSASDNECSWGSSCGRKGDDLLI